MPNVNGPYLVRDEAATAEPGIHSHSRSRRSLELASEVFPLHWLRRTLLLFGLAALGYYAYSLADQDLYQSYENWSFDQQIAGRSSVTFADYVRERTLLGSLLGKQDMRALKPVATPSQPDKPVVPHGAILGRVSVARLGISAIVREGVDAGTLSTAVGHVPSTALPGQQGNFSIAAHRDTLFRALRNIRIGDFVEFQSTAGTYRYQVISTQIVRPSDVSVLRADGGPVLVHQIPNVPSKLLTMITCYPFNYIGSAPERFIVQAAAVSDAAPRSPPVRPPRVAVTHSARTSVSLRRRTEVPVLPPQSHVKTRKRGFWRRLFHVG
jgi:sortase A